MKRYILASDPQELIEKVNQAIEDGFDLYTSLFATFEGKLCQRMVIGRCPYEYKLIHVNSIDELKTEETNLALVGFDYVFNTIMFHGEYLQWMCRMKPAASTVRDSVAIHDLQAAANLFFENATPQEEMALVEGVRSVLRLEPTAKGYVVKLPHPLLGS